MSVAKATAYTAKDITVLEGLEPVRQRPAMYIGSVGKDGYHHLLAEIVDNSVDEAMNGHASRVDVTLSADRTTVTVSDDGRGIPVDLHPTHKLPAVTLILTTLHAGGKFGHQNYLHSGGLHGVGASVVNALAEHLEVKVRRDGNEWAQTFVRGRPAGPLKKGAKVKGTGTAVTFRPDEEIFGHTLRFDPDRVRQSLEDRAFVHRGIKFVYTDELAGAREEFLQKEGIAALLRRGIERQGLHPTVPAIFELSRDGNPKKGDILSRLEVVLTYTDATDERFLSYVNGIRTPSGGTHEAGVRAAVSKAVRQYMTTHKKAVPSGVKVTAEDIREGVVAIVSLFISDPQFLGQTKTRLNNPDVAPAVENLVWPVLEQWLNENASHADAIVARVVMSARARQASREAAETVRKTVKTGRRGSLPDKLADCSSQRAEECELFIVEGDSAGGSAKQGRDNKRQAVLPLRGKVLNTEQATLKKVLETKELADLVKALGCGVGETFDLGNLNYHKIVLLMDADSDGDHITTLLLTFFFRYLPKVIEAGHLFVARPPLFKLELGKDVFWAANEDERDQLLAKHGKGRKPVISRFKGLGEMDPKVLAETTLDPKRRTLLRVAVSDAQGADKVIQELMGRDPAARFQFIMDEAPTVEDVDV
ncbi:MAG: type IIA DNA topoisomerase subunit B [Planctomycetes bacterium]|nr:type IIA DNA topoisomerase subunit B [Planctomycetota bacterium]